MAKHAGRLVSSFLMYSSAFSIIFAMTLQDGWYLSGKYNFHFSGRISRAYQYLGYVSSYAYNVYSPGQSNAYYSYNQYEGGSDLTTAIYILLLVSVGFTGLCVLLCFIMICADCCCRITKCMTVIPKITSGFSQVAGLLAEAACVVFLVKISLGDKVAVTPYYCFYLVGVSGILLMIAGCINCGVKHATRVEDSGHDDGDNVESANSGIRGQGALQQQQVMYAGGMAPLGMMPYYPPPQTAFANQAYGSYPAKVFLTHAFTQTSQVDVKKDSND